MTLKALEVKGFKPSQKTYRKSDERGLYLEIRPSGSKLWFLKYRIDGKEKRLGLFRHGVATARCDSDPALLLAGALSTPIVKHHAAILEPKPLGEFLRAVDDYTGGPIVKIAMQLSPHVFLRPGELRQGRWEEINWEEASWTVPASRTKLRRPHSVPLSRQSLELLRALEQHTGGFELMFTGTRSFRTPMSENAVNSAFRRMGFGADVVTAHGLRSTASTLLNESGKWQSDAIERALAHGDSDATRGSYARGQFWDERVRMAQWWSDYLDQVKAGGQVVELITSTSHKVV